MPSVPAIVPPGAVATILTATLTAALVTNKGRSAWLLGVLLRMVCAIFAIALSRLPPQGA